MTMPGVYLLPQSRGMGRCQAIAAVASWDPVALSTEVNDQDLGPIMEEAEAAHYPELKDITNCSPMYKSYWA
jgi:hypothetical protein